MEQSNIFVYIQCPTFNQASYIVNTMNGFTMQQTTFPYVCCIIDDASTDGEPEVIRQYLKEHFDLEDKSVVRNEETDDYILIFAQHKTNKNCYFVVYLLKYNHYSIKKTKMPYISKWRDNAKYIAICEGDDYWIHPEKLKMEVDFFEKNEDYGLVYTDYYERIGDKIQKGRFPVVNDITDCLLKKGYIPTATTMFRTNLYLQCTFEKKFLLGDVPLWLQLMHVSKIKRLPEITAVYRLLPESASHSQDFEKRQKFIISTWEARKYYADKYGYTDIGKQIEKNIIRCKALLAFYQGRYWDFFKMRPWKYGIKYFNEVLKILWKRLGKITK